MSEMPEGIAAVGLVLGILFLMWLPVLWGRYQASRASILRPWKFGLVSGIAAHGAALLFGSLVSLPYEVLVAPHVAIGPYLQAREAGVSINALALLLANISPILDAAFLIAMTVVAPKLLIPAWQKLQAQQVLQADAAAPRGLI